MNSEDADSNTGQRCKHDLIPEYCGLREPPTTEQGGRWTAVSLAASSCRPTSIPARIVSRSQGTEYESPSLKAGSSLRPIQAISHPR